MVMVVWPPTARWFYGVGKIWFARNGISCAEESQSTELAPPSSARHPPRGCPLKTPSASKPSGSVAVACSRGRRNNFPNCGLEAYPFVVDQRVHSVGGIYFPRLPK